VARLLGSFGTAGELTCQGVGGAGLVGMVFSFSVAILIAAHSITRGLAFAIFVGTTGLQPRLAQAFTTGVHAAFYASMGFMVCAAALSAVRVRHALRPDRA